LILGLVLTTEFFILFWLMRQHATIFPERAFPEWALLEKAFPENSLKKELLSCLGVNTSMMSLWLRTSL